MKTTQKTLYHKKGQAVLAVSAITTLIIGVGAAVMILIFVGALGGQTYNLVQADIDNINDTDIKDNVKAGIKSGFVALKQTGSYLPIVVLAVVISIVLLLVLSFTQFSRPGMGGGSVL